MVTYRLANAEEFDAYTDLADQVFQGVGAKIEFRKALPKVYTPEAGMHGINRVAVDDRQGIRALIAVLPGVLHTPCGDLRTGFVGTVCVHPENRGEGHMKRLMADWISEETARGCDLMLLGGQRQRYGYFGFTQGGERWLLSVSRHAVKHALRELDASGITFREILPGSEDEAYAARLHNVAAVHYDREWCGFTVACRSYGNAPWIALEHGEPVGYLVAKCERPGEIGECRAENPTSLDLILKAWLLQHEVYRLEVCVPVWDREALLHLRTWADDTTCTHSLMVRVLHYPRVISTLLNLKSHWTELTDGELAMSVDGQDFTITVRDNVCHVTDGAQDPLVLTGLQAQAMLFDPFPQDGVPAPAVNWFPLPLSSTEPDEF